MQMFTLWLQFWLMVPYLCLLDSTVTQFVLGGPVTFDTETLPKKAKVFLDVHVYENREPKMWSNFVVQQRSPKISQFLWSDKLSHSKVLFRTVALVFYRT